MLTPLLLGVSLGAVASGRVVAPTQGTFVERFVEPWLTPFAFGVGLLTLALFALPDDPVIAHVALFGLSSLLVILGSGRWSLDRFVLAPLGERIRAQG